MIGQAQWANLGGLVFVARRLVEGVFAGQHPSLRRGPGLEFHDYRPYVPGDDVGDVDWKLFGRTDRLHVRRHRQLTDLHLYTLLDASGSMDFAPLARDGRRHLTNAFHDKHTYAAALVGAILFLTLRQGDRAGLGIAQEHLTDHFQPQGSWPHLFAMCQAIERRRPQGLGRIGAGLAQAHALLKRRGLLVLISDLLDEPATIFDGLDRFRHDRFDVIVFHVLTKQELDLVGLEQVQARFIDAETRDALVTDARHIRQGYTQLLGQHLDTLRRGCVARGIDYHLLTTDQPHILALRQYLTRRSALMR